MIGVANETVELKEFGNRAAVLVGDLGQRVAAADDVIDEFHSASVQLD
ncbi:hypothetical protein PSEUDO8AS_10395 [Pseudomonas sp. 8AS]|nr:hypothetical protein PSEUDO8AS_10395 [Pseudomonas sp. 8AS]